MDLRRSPTSARGTSAYRACDHGRANDPERGVDHDRANDLGHDRVVQNGVDLDRAHDRGRLLQRRPLRETTEQPLLHKQQGA